MTTDSVIAAVAQEYVDFCLDDADEEEAGAYENHCVYAHVFGMWVDDMLEEYVRTNPTQIRVAQAKVLLVDRFFEWRASVPKSHRNRIGGTGHVCLFHVFDQAYQRIKLAQMTVTPPAVVIHTPPEQPYQIAGVPFGIKK